MAASIPSRPRRGAARRVFSGLAGLVLVLLALLVGAAFLVQARIDPEALRQRIEAQCLQATGRVLSLDNVHLSLLPVPTLTATGVALAGLPTDSRPQMLRATSLSAHLALWPLIHHVARLDGVTLSDPDLLLERDAAGHANWRFTPQPRLAGDGPGSTPRGGARWRVEINSLRSRDGAIAWRDATGGWSGAASLDRLDATGLAGDHPRIELVGRHGTAGFSAELATGPLLPLLDRAAPASRAPWPLHLLARTGRNDREDAALSADGTIADPARLRGFALDLRLNAPHPDGIDALFPNAAVPASGPVLVSTRLVDEAPATAVAADAVPQRLQVRAEQVDLGALLHRAWSRSLLLDHLSMDAANRTAPLSVSAAGTWQRRPVSVSGTAGTLESWRREIGAGENRTGTPATAQATAPAPFDLSIHVGDAEARVNGTADRQAVTATVRATAPALRALLPVGPALTGMTLSAAIGVSADRHLVIDGLDLRSNELALSGHARLAGGAHPSVDAVLSSAHLNLDALRAGWVDLAPDATQADAAGNGAADAGETRADRSMPSDGGSAVAPANEPSPPGAIAPGVTKVRPIPFARLRCCDAAIRFTADAVTVDGVLFRALSAGLQLHDGMLTLSPLTATGPAGPIDLSLQADAARNAMALQARPSMLPATLLATWLHRTPALQGTVEVVADLKGAGDTVQAVERSLAGHLGLSMVDGTIATEALGQLIGRPQAASAGADAGRTAFRCLALPASLSGGIATLDPIALSTSRLAVGGRGTVALPDGRLDLHLTPRLAIGATGASLPVRIGGTLDAPEAALDPSAPGGRFSLSIGGAAPPDPCGPALAAARFGDAGPSPGTAPAEGRHKLPKPIDILRGLGLFH